MNGRCGACAAPVPDDARFCPSCGARQAAFSELSTRSDNWVPLPSPRHGKLGSSDAASGDGFASGAMLGNRFRIIGLLGRGGMGEVYRADDLTLGQPVALKFLPLSVTSHPGSLQRFYAEVRTARQISHPNVCRVYDVGQIDGRHFLSMEFIDGEDLASLLKRIGHLPSAKVLEIARQLCGGLSAAHRKGVIHRDLKPANVMVDGRGYARITDFGLAVALDHDADVRAAAGTPMYMAPEQLAGQGASVRSDIYALGLVLYELCTGRLPFRARTLEDLRLEKESVVPVPPSEISRDVDADVERVILKCLDRDPRARPSSVVQVAAGLPGANPLAAVLAEGETPSPEMVAALAPSEGLSPAVAALLIGMLVLSAGLSIWLGARAILPRRVPLDRPPEVFVDRAREIARRAGYSATPVDTAFGIAYDDRYLQWVEGRQASPDTWAALSPDAVRFWYRQSQTPLRRLAFSIGVSPMVTPTDPPIGGPGDVLVVLNGSGRLRALLGVPSGAVVPPAPLEDTWRALFEDAGLDTRDWTVRDAGWKPTFWADQRLNWTPRAAGAIASPAAPPAVPANRAAPAPVVTQIDAATLAGAVTVFRDVAPWDNTGANLETALFYDRGFGGEVASAGQQLANLTGIALTAVAMVGGLILARRNLRLGRGDRRGASRLTATVVALLTISWILDEHHVSDAHEWYLFVSFAGRALVVGGIFWWTYVAFEPYVRRHWPSNIVSWSRLLTGGFRDPLIGRDVLIGCSTGALVTCLVLVEHLLPTWLGRPAERLATPTWHAWLGAGHAISLSLQLVCNALLESFTALFVLVVLRIWLRRDWLAALVAAALLATPDILLSLTPSIAAVFFVGIYLLGVLLLMRIGLLAVVALRFCIDLLQVYPVILNLSAWYSGLGLGALALLVAIVAMSVRVSVGKAKAYA